MKIKRRYIIILSLDRNRKDQESNSLQYTYVSKTNNLENFNKKQKKNIIVNIMEHYEKILLEYKK